MLRTAKAAVSVLLLLFLCNYNTVYAQDALKDGLGTIDKAWLKMEYYEQDSSAAAVVLDERVMYKIDTRLNLYWTVRRTIKILTPDGFDYADQSLPVFRKDIQIKELQAYSHNLDENGEISTTPLEAGSLMDETNAKGRTVAKIFTMPNVRKGTVIDLYYQLYFNDSPVLPPWTFQEKVPVAKSALYAEYPNQLQFEASTRSYYPFTIKNAGSNPDTKTNYIRLEIENLPAFKNEKFITIPADYLTRVEFNIARVSGSRDVYGNVRKVDFRDTWDDLGNQFVNTDNVKSFLVASPNFNKLLADSIREANNYEPLAIAKSLHSYLVNKVTTKRFGIVPSTRNVKVLLKNGEGSVPDINMAYVLLARRTGLQANPVWISTRANGRVTRLNTPGYQLFNYLAVKLNIEGKVYLTTAADPLQPFGNLPAYCLNGEGLAISKNGTVEWVPLIGTGNSTEFVNVQVNIDPESQETKVKYHQEFNGYEATGLRKKLVNNGEEKLKEGLTEKFDGWEMESFAIKGHENLEQSVSIDLEMVNYSFADGAGETLYIPVNIDQRWKDNPLKKEERKFSVDMNYPWAETYMMVLQVPEGYQVESLPESIVYRLPDQSAQFTFGANSLGKMVQITSRIQFKKAVYTVGEYPGIKDIMSSITGRFNEMIVLKKIN